MVKMVNLVRTQCYLWRHIVVVKLNMLKLTLTFQKKYLHLEGHLEKNGKMTFRVKVCDFFLQCI